MQTFLRLRNARSCHTFCQEFPWSVLPPPAIVETKQTTITGSVSYQSSLRRRADCDYLMIRWELFTSCNYNFNTFTFGFLTEISMLYRKETSPYQLKQATQKQIYPNKWIGMKNFPRCLHMVISFHIRGFHRSFDNFKLKKNPQQLLCLGRWMLRWVSIGSC